jgi:neutral ceramidase
MIKTNRKLLAIGSQIKMRILKRFLVPVFLLLFVNVSYSQQADKSVIGTKGFRAAVVKIDITPDNSQILLGYSYQKSIGILDHIYHRIVVLDDGKTQFFLVSTDICEYSPSIYDSVAIRLEKQLGIKPVNFLWATTHTHSAPEVGPEGLEAAFLGGRFQHQIDPDYTAMVVKTLIEGVMKARQNLVPARLGVGWGFSSSNINRRAKDIDGQATLGMDPDGPVDRKIGLLRIDKEDGTPLVLIANYPIHGTVLGPANLKISGDVPGIVSEYVEEKIGAPVLFINGALGNLAPIYSVYPDSESGHLGQFRVILGDKILEANRKISTTTNDVTLTPGAIVVETPRKAGLEWVSYLGKYTRTTKAGEKLVRLPVRFLKINEDIAIWCAPLELFCEVSNEIRDRSPFPYTFYFGLTNGWLGYMLPESEFKYAGYESTVTPYTPGGARDLTEAVVTYFQGKMRNPAR